MSLLHTILSTFDKGWKNNEKIVGENKGMIKVEKKESE